MSDSDGVGSRRRPRLDRCCARAEILNVNILQRHRQQRTRPAGVARRRLIQKRQNASVRRRAVDWLLACPRAIIQSSKPMIGKAMPPFADNTRLNAYFLGDRTCAGAFGRQQHYLRPLQVALRRARDPAVRLKQLCVSSASAELLLLRESSRSHSQRKVGTSTVLQTWPASPHRFQRWSASFKAPTLSTTAEGHRPAASHHGNLLLNARPSANRPIPFASAPRSKPDGSAARA